MVVWEANKRQMPFFGERNAPIEVQEMSSTAHTEGTKARGAGRLWEKMEPWSWFPTGAQQHSKTGWPPWNVKWVPSPASQCSSGSSLQIVTRFSQMKDEALSFELGKSNVEERKIRKKGLQGNKRREYGASRKRNNSHENWEGRVVNQKLTLQ